MGGRARAPQATAQEGAMARRQEEELNTVTAKSEKKFKALSRNKLGAKTLLTGAVAPASKPSFGTSGSLIR